MSQSDDAPKNSRAQHAFNLTLAAVAGQVGCLTLVVIFLSLFAGLWLDNQFQSRPLFTILLLVGSVPVTIIGMFWVVRKATSHIRHAPEARETDQEANVNTLQEDVERGK